MLHRLLIISFLTFSFCVLNPLLAQSESEMLKSILQDQWVLKYKKLKKELEQKAGNIKSMPGLTESQTQEFKEEYNKTSNLLQDWLSDFSKSLKERETYEGIKARGTIVNEGLQEVLTNIEKYYIDNFSFQYDFVTQTHDKNPLKYEITASNFQLMTSAPDKEQTNKLSKEIRKPLTPLRWNDF